MRLKLIPESSKKIIDVIFYTIQYFFKGANITPSDLTKRLLVILISGTSTLLPSG
ncbi:uncharacterized protein N7500_001986 [Penicillium coprophilum]|uniref:uncharacterized protein n=1 Tax=Penicillium coprophilum TaxID=36646 RepID=UPI00238CCB3A|nr:uncharacterized protein N7500_001986 [Penicillium coprophilum]KAJ5174055.1 hypothetical protein N7500_001986 [Penicillium coprophilum]